MKPGVTTDISVIYAANLRSAPQAKFCGWPAEGPITLDIEVIHDIPYNRLLLLAQLDIARESILNGAVRMPVHGHVSCCQCSYRCIRLGGHENLENGYSRRTGERNYEPWVERRDPGKGELSRRDTLLLCDGLEFVDELHVMSEEFRVLESREIVAYVTLWEIVHRLVFASKETTTQRAICINVRKSD